MVHTKSGLDSQSRTPLSNCSVNHEDPRDSSSLILGRRVLQLISVNIPAFEVAIAAVAAPHTDCQGFGVWSLLIISVVR